MRAHVLLTPGELRPEHLQCRSAVVIDVMRAGTTIVTALSRGCRTVIPVLTPEEAWGRMPEFPAGSVLLGGERGGEPIEGFDLGNSPREYAPDRVAGRVIILTTTNGTRTLVASRSAAASAVGALVNVKAVARWAAAQERDLTVLCAGEAGGVSLEDAVCAGLIAEELATHCSGIEPSATALICRAVAREYRDRLDDLRTDSRWARHLERIGRGEDVSACLDLDASSIVPLFLDGVLRAG